MDIQPFSHTLTMGARALGALPPCNDDQPAIHHFVVGTSSAQDHNQLHVFEYNEDMNTVSEVMVYDHPQEIYSITTSHTLADKVFTCYADPDGVDDSSIALWAVHRSQEEAKLDAAEAEADRGKSDDTTNQTEATQTSTGPAIDLRSGKTRGAKLRQILKLASVPFENEVFADLPMSACGGRTQSSPLQLLWNMEASAPSGAPTSSSVYASTAGDTTLMTLHYGGVATWQIDQGTSMIHCTAHSRVPLASPITCGAWDPHHSQTLAVTGNGTTLRLWDTHSTGIQQAGMIKCAHSDNILSLDFNPNKPHHLTTAGADGQVYVWDLRKTTSPVLMLQGHHHWVTSVRHNRFHDQLLLTAGSEGAVSLWNALSTSSVPNGSGNALNDVAMASSGADLSSHGVAASGPAASLNNPKSESKLASEKDSDRLIRRYADFEESVVGLTWSRVHAWVFASLSIDGRFQVAQVPASEKYRILL